MSEPSRRSKHQDVFEDEDAEISYVASAMASVSASDWESNIDPNVSTVFSIPPSIE